MAISRMIGATVRRKEDPRLITGASSYVDDIRRVDLLYLEFVRSPYAHARIGTIDFSRAADLEGVIDVITHDDIKDAVAPIPAGSLDDDTLKADRHPLAHGKVRLVGEAVAAVIADDRYIARDAAQLVDVEYEPLKAAVDVEKAMEADAPMVWEEHGTNIAYRYHVGSEDIDDALQKADRVFSYRYVNQRLIPNPMETRGVVVDPQPDGGFTMWTSTQIPHIVKNRIAEGLSIPENQVRIIAPEVGGGFGCKLNVYAEEYATAFAALRLGRPVKWIEDRTESFIATTHGRGQVNYIEVGVQADGQIVALKTKIIADLGAYHQLFTPAIPTLSATMMVGPYAIPSAYTEIFGVFTNKTPTDAYRGAGRPEATYFLERAMDQVANDMGIDPVEFRRRNFIRPEQFPYETPTETTYDSGDYEPALDRALELIDYQGFLKEQGTSRAEGRYLGVGFSSWVEICGFGPSKDMGMAMWESGTVRVEQSGKVTVLTGASPHGQGQETTFAQLVADDLGVPFDDIVVLHGDTALINYGVGTFGSRAAVVGGTALRMSTDKIKEKAKLIASHMLEASPDDLVYENGAVSVRGAPTRSVPFDDIAAEAHEFQVVPGDSGIEPGLEATSLFNPANWTFPFGTHAVTVEVDSETGEIELLKYVAVDDCGRVLSPMLVDGQRHGGIAQGIGQALFEGAVYDDSGQLLSGSLMDYTVPVASQLLSFVLDRTETPSPENLLGVKGIGEAGTIAATPAVVNAVVNALTPFGITDIEMPMTPQRVWKAIRAADDGGRL